MLFWELKYSSLVYKFYVKHPKIEGRAFIRTWQHYWWVYNSSGLIYIAGRQQHSLTNHWWTKQAINDSCFSTLKTARLCCLTTKTSRSSLSNVIQCKKHKWDLCGEMKPTGMAPEFFGHSTIKRKQISLQAVNFSNSFIKRFIITYFNCPMLNTILLVLACSYSPENIIQFNTQ